MKYRWSLWGAANTLWELFQEMGRPNSLNLFCKAAVGRTLLDTSRALSVWLSVALSSKRITKPYS